jgi:hypothetical protein
MTSPLSLDLTCRGSFKTEVLKEPLYFIQKNGFYAIQGLNLRMPPPKGGKRRRQKKKSLEEVT